jgi:uncharacterized protein (TIGR02453 family)
MAKRPYFAPALFRFLRELTQNNAREWFMANKARYERDVRAPMLRFITDFGPPLKSISAHFVADARPAGGSLFRIHRDVRFARDKSPYKTMAAAQFRHESGRDVHAPGFYLHLGPGEVFAGAGLWHPDSPTLAKVRDAIVATPDAYRRAMSGRAFRALCVPGGESLKRSPQGYDLGHPLIEDLKRKDFVVTTAFDERIACAADFLDRFAEACRAAAPFNRFLTRAVGLPW